MDKRPELNKDIKVEDFRDFYWLKEELLIFCKKTGINRQGGKIEIANRIEEYLKTGKIINKSKITKQKTTSKFDWNREILTLETKITDNYKNTENVRAFFTEKIGKIFKFNVKFMNWMKSNINLTLKDAIQQWNSINNEKKQSKISPQFEYNQYIRDFMKNNHDKTKKIAIEYWKIKKSQRGNNIYKKTDLKLK